MKTRMEFIEAKDKKNNDDDVFVLARIMPVHVSLECSKQQEMQEKTPMVRGKLLHNLCSRQTENVQIDTEGESPNSRFQSSNFPSTKS